MGWLPANPWLAALAGLAATAVFLGGFTLVGWLLGQGARRAIGYTVAQWKTARVQRFWLINMLFAPALLAYFALAVWALRLTAGQIGFNLHQAGLSLAWALPVAAVMGGYNAVVAPLAARHGVRVMDVEFGRSLTDVVGAIAYMAVLVGPLEEIPFRGIIQTVLMAALPQALHGGRFTVLLGTLVGVAVFVLYHYRNVLLGGETRVQFLRLLPGRTLVSLFLGLLFQGTGSLLGPVIFHNIIDTCIVAALSITLYRQRLAAVAVPEV